ncbi:uncharacterized protein METZ01_LOCUS450654 [marine metagenome]|jgi:hypothetical protein|uniref:Uncharacterized protein n=1 Tax=marine metagenome TaxID=408172 RepID=A0A382ZR72_9ZZZZ|tara:strand:- start:734 stop:994 length:261 start_codon:yes stop_codon:yes gene_type:complete
MIYLIPSFTGINNYYKINELDLARQYAIQEHWNPNSIEIQKELDIYRGNYKDQLNYRSSMYKPSGNSGKDLIVISFLLDFFRGPLV